MHLGQHDVRRGVGEKAAAAHGGQLRRIAEHKDRLAKRQKIAAERLVDHRAFVDDDELGAGDGALFVQHKHRLLGLGVARPVDQAVDGARALAAFRAQHQRRLAGVGGKAHLAVGVFGELSRERRLAGAGVAEQPEDLRLAALQPGGDGLEGVLLLRRPVQGVASGTRRGAAEQVLGEGIKSDLQLARAAALGLVSATCQPASGKE